MTQASIQIHVDSVLVSEVVAMRQKVQTFLDAEPDAQLGRFMFIEEGASAKLNVTLLVINATIPGLSAIRTKIQSYLDSQPNSHLTLFTYVED